MRAEFVDKNEGDAGHPDGGDGAQMWCDKPENTADMAQIIGRGNGSTSRSPTSSAASGA